MGLVLLTGELEFRPWHRTQASPAHCGLSSVPRTSGTVVPAKGLGEEGLKWFALGTPGSLQLHPRPPLSESAV